VPSPLDDPAPPPPPPATLDLTKKPTPDGDTTTSGGKQGSGNQGAPPTIDVTTPKPGGGTVSQQELPPRTSEWAKIARPFTFFILWLIAAVMLLPFLWFLVPRDNTDMLDWAKTILAPVIGFGGAVVGYYFGTSGSSGGSKTQ
jgi:hypothetical protein